jgi:hypothetical protein
MPTNPVGIAIQEPGEAETSSSKTHNARADMPPIGVRILAASVAAAMVVLSSAPITAQNGEQKPAEKPPAAEAKEPAKKVDEFAEAEKALAGPAGNPECVWLGRRVVNLLWRDDLDTAFRHLDLYDRFGCPSDHIQTTFRCVVRQGNIDPKATDTLNGRVHACWLNPTQETQGAAAAAPTATTSR